MYENLNRRADCVPIVREISSVNSHVFPVERSCRGSVDERRNSRAKLSNRDRDRLTSSSSVSPRDNDVRRRCGEEKQRRRAGRANRGQIKFPVPRGISNGNFK